MRIDEIRLPLAELFQRIGVPTKVVPFARQVIANAVAAGGFPPLLINPVDFVAMYREKREEMLKQAEAQKASGTAAVN